MPTDKGHMFFQEKDVAVHPSIDLGVPRTWNSYCLKNIVIIFAKIRCNSEKNNGDTKLIYTVHIYNRISKPNLPPLFVYR